MTDTAEIKTNETLKHNRYADYKDSGVDWLGEIPAHWEVVKSKYLWKERIDLSENGDEMLLSVSQYTGVGTRDDGSRTESLVGYKKVQKNDLVINIMLAWLGGLGLSSFSGVVSPAYAVYRQTKDLNPKFLHYLYRTSIYLDEFGRRSKGVVPSRWRMYTDDFGQVITLLAPLTEQTRIAEFLDRKTAQIDQAIAQKERLIELLNERRQVMIHQAVTRGLNPDVPMKDSGIEWIGEIPAHWEVSRLKYITEVQSGITLGKTYLEKNAVSVPYLRVANVQDGFLNLDDMAEISVPRRIIPNFLLKKNDILVTEGGDIDKLGRGAVWYDQIKPCIHQNHVFAIRTTSKSCLPQFIALLLSCDYGKKYFTTTANKTTNLASTNKTKLGNFPVLIMPLNEQQDIHQAVDSMFNLVDSSIYKIQGQIEKLKELKSTLINSAVTGKIKV